MATQLFYQHTPIDTAIVINSLCVITINTLTDVQMMVGGAYLRKWKLDLGKRSCSINLNNGHVYITRVFPMDPKQPH